MECLTGKKSPNSKLSSWSGGPISDRLLGIKTLASTYDLHDASPFFSGNGVIWITGWLKQIILLEGRQSIDMFCVDTQYVFNKLHQHCDAVTVLLHLKREVLPTEGV